MKHTLSEKARALLKQMREAPRSTPVAGAIGWLASRQVGRAAMPRNDGDRIGVGEGARQKKPTRYE